MESLPIINRTYEIYKLADDTIAHMEKRWRYSIGQSLEASILSCLEQLILAKNAPRALKVGYLLQASSHLEIVVLKARLCLEVTDANETKIFQLQGKCAEIGRMLGGWLKSLT